MSDVKEEPEIGINQKERKKPDKSISGLYSLFLTDQIKTNSHPYLHPQSQGLQIYSLHHRCQESS